MSKTSISPEEESSTPVSDPPKCDGCDGIFGVEVPRQSLSNEKAYWSITGYTICEDCAQYIDDSIFDL